MTRRSKPEDSKHNSVTDLALRHIRFGWWSLLLFLALGFALEALHAFKAGIYLDVSSEARRLMWTLAHAHGTLLSLVHIAFAVSLRDAPVGAVKHWRIASPLLISGSILLPAGFFLGGWFIFDGDPGLGVFLVPLGAVILLVGVFQTARIFSARPIESTRDTAPRGKRPRK